MSNPFDILDARLSAIEGLLFEIKRAGAIAIDNTVAPVVRKALDINALCDYAGLKKSTVYKLTSTDQIPHSKRGKRLYFDRDAIDDWLLSNQIGTRAEAEKQADDYLMQRATRRTR